MKKHEILESSDIDTLAEDLYKDISAKMSQEDILEWLDSMVDVSAQHMNHCGFNTDSIDDVDEAFLMYENAFLFVLGLAKHNGLLQHRELH